MTARIGPIIEPPPQADTESSLRLAEFLRSPAGRYVLGHEQLHLDAAVANAFGYHALQLGLPQIDALRENRMPLRILASDRLVESPGPEAGELPPHSQIAVINRFDELPFASQSIDLVVMPHLLEFAAEPHQVLREVDRVLVPEGTVVITGFNPASLWGARQFGARWGRGSYLPREAQLIGLPRLKDWLKLLSFEVQRGRFACYAPPVKSGRWLARWNFMEHAGNRWWPVLGAMYMLCAIKRVRAMRLIGPAWKRSEELKPAFAPAASRGLVRTGEAGVRVLRENEAAKEAPRGARR